MSVSFTLRSCCFAGQGERGERAEGGGRGNRLQQKMNRAQPRSALRMRVSCPRWAPERGGGCRNSFNNSPPSLPTFPLSSLLCFLLLPVSSSSLPHFHPSIPFILPPHDRPSHRPTERPSSHWTTRWEGATSRADTKMHFGVERVRKETSFFLASSSLSHRVAAL